MTDLFWVFAAWPVASVGAGVLVGKCIAYGQRPPRDPEAVEREAYASIYSLRAWERRTDIPARTDKWT